MVDDFQRQPRRASSRRPTAIKPNKADWLEGAWSGLEIASGDDRRGEHRRSSMERCRRSATRAHRACPSDFNAQPQDRAPAARPSSKMFETGEGIDWATGRGPGLRHAARSKAIRVRLSGQDAGRGTFSQRHAVLVDQETEARLHAAQQHPPRPGASSRSSTSPLSEAGVLGFEYGYSPGRSACARACWEAQFGDFANGAQVIIDQFIACRRGEVAAHVGPRRCCCRTATRARGRSTRSARLERYPAAVRRGQHAGRQLHDAGATTSTRCAGRCAATSASR